MNEFWSFTGSFFEVFNILVAGFLVGWSMRGWNSRNSEREEAVASSLSAHGDTIVIHLRSRGSGGPVELSPEKPANGRKEFHDGRTDGQEA